VKYLTITSFDTLCRSLPLCYLYVQCILTCAYTTGQPDRPANIRVGYITRTSCVVQWDEGHYAEWYIIHWFDSSVDKEATTLQTSFIIILLTPNTTYEVDVAAVNYCGQQSSTINVTTKAALSNIITSSMVARTTPTGNCNCIIIKSIIICFPSPACIPQVVSIQI